MPDHQPRAGRDGVLVTRAASESDRTAERLRALGFQPVVAPLLLVRTAAVAWPKRVDAVLVTSGNAIPSLSDLPPDLPVFAVGDATAARAVAVGLADVRSASGDAAALLELVRRSMPAGARLLLATGAGQGTTLAAGLRDAGFRVHRRVAYCANPVARLPASAEAALDGGGLRAALFLSAETARIFGRLLPPHLRPALAGVEALAIARPVADALAPLPWRRVRVSVGPTLDQVLALL